MGVVDLPKKNMKQGRKIVCFNRKRWTKKNKQAMNWVCWKIEWNRGDVYLRYLPIKLQHKGI